MSNRLSVCLLTRDEERNIARAIRSVEGLADEVVVVDTGSTDATNDIARAHGARIVPFAWDDDFAAGRNFVLGQATGDWVLWLNPDEELLPQSHDEVRSLLSAGDDVFGYLARVQDVTDANHPDRYSETFDLRLYRRRPDLCYVGRLHPVFTPEFARAVAAEGRQVHPSGIGIRRHAYMSVLTDVKLRWAIRLLERELADRPGQLRYLMEYGRNLLLLKNPQGHDVMAEALQQLQPFLDAPAPPSSEAQMLLEYVLVTQQPPYCGFLTRAQAGALVGRWFPNSPPLLWVLAESHSRTGQYRAAAELLERLISLGATGTYDHSQKFDPRILGPWAWFNLGQCYRALGDPARARRCYTPFLQDPEYGARAAQLLAECG